MKIKLILFAITTTFLSSCCWLTQDDCLETSATFTLPVSINYMDSVINVNDPLSITIESSAFQSYYEDNGYNQNSISLNITWFDGNFTSQANHKVDLISSNLPSFNLQEYSGYSSDKLPQDIELELGFTVPGYYLIQFSGSANRYEEIKRRQCGCGDYTYQSFLFESNLNNSQYFNLYQTSISYAPSLAELNFQGAFFIKVV